MHNWRFKQILSNLLGNPELVVLHHHTPPPATEAHISAALEALAPWLHSPLEPAMLEFYRVQNGFQLAWIDKRNPAYDPTVHTPQGNEKVPWHHYEADYRAADGVIMLQPIHWWARFEGDEYLYFDWMDDTEILDFMGEARGLRSFCQSIRPIDMFSKYYGMILVLDNQRPHPLLLAEDHYAALTDSYVTTFESYLAFLSASNGLVSARKEFFGKHAGHKLGRRQWDDDFFVRFPIPTRNEYPTPGKPEFS